MPTSLIIVDDFLDNAQALRRTALGLTYPEVQGMFPGRNSVERITLEGLDAQVSRLVGEPLVGMPPPQAHGKFRLARADDRQAQAHGYPTAKQFVADVLARDTMDDSKWEMTHRVPMRFNRLILLRPWLWHTAGESFGTTPEDSRLVYLMFFESARR